MNVLQSYMGGQKFAESAGQAQQQSAQYVEGIQRNNALKAFISDPKNVAALMQGDPNALAGYAAASGDPTKALGLMKTQLGIEGQRLTNQRTEQAINIDSQSFALEREKAKQEAAARAFEMSQDELEAEREATERVINGAIQAPDEQAYNEYMRANDADELVGTWAQREMIAASALGAKDAIELAREAQAGPKPLSAPGKVQADIASGLLPEGTPLRSQGTSRTVYGPDGSVVYSEGAAAPKMTVDAAKNSGFYLRTKEANEVLNDLENQGTRLGQQVLGNAPLGLGNYGRDEDFQRYDQARRDFVNAILRRESGAVIADSEFDNADKQYFPQPGDSPEVIAQKRRNRETAIEGVRMGAGEGANYADQLGGAQAGGLELTPERILSLTPDEIGQVDVMQMDAEQLDAFEARAVELGF